MKSKPSMSALRSLLFVFDIENTKSVERERMIVSKDINDDVELAELFDALLRSDFLVYRQDERQRFIDAVFYYLAAGDDFNGLFDGLDTYFDTDIEDQRRFMGVLLNCLKRYQAESAGA